jgi:hypothetical protein
MAVATVILCMANAAGQILRSYRPFSGWRFSMPVNLEVAPSLGFDSSSVCRLLHGHSLVY